MQSNFSEEDNKEQEEIIRFMQDLEFVQCLSNPYYLKYLSNMGYFDDDNFINYLQYLLYFRKAEYMKYITYERCILFLELLQFKEFRQKFKENDYEKYLDNFLYDDWINRNYKTNQENINENNESNENKENDKENDKENVINNNNDDDMDIEI